MNTEKYLPIGTVAILKNATKRVMITGFAVKAKEAGDTMFDYIGCVYPEGVISTDNNIVFNHDQIEKVFYMGFLDEEWVNVEQKLKEIVAHINGTNSESNTEQVVQNQTVSQTQVAMQTQSIDQNKTQENINQENSNVVVQNTNQVSQTQTNNNEQTTTILL